MTAHSHVYTSNVYLLRGEWNALEDVNTLIDVGLDPSLFERLESMSTGVGKKRVDAVILTHSHYDHASLLPRIKHTYDPVVYGYTDSLDTIDYRLAGTEHLRVGDDIAHIMYTPFHSADSICIYCADTQVLFSGDVQVVHCSAEGTYHPAYARFLEELLRMPIEVIYPGHGEPISHNIPHLLRQSLNNVIRSCTRTTQGAV